MLMYERKTTYEKALWSDSAVSTAHFLHAVYHLSRFVQV